MRFVTLITLVVIASSLLLITMVTIPPYVYGTTSTLVSGPHISAQMEAHVKLSDLRPPATIIDTVPSELTEIPKGPRQAGNLNAAGAGEECRAGALKYRLLTCRIYVEIHLAGKPQNGSVRVDGYVIVGNSRRDFHIAVPGLSGTYLRFTNVSCTDEFRIVITNINASASYEASLKNLSLFYSIYVNGNTVNVVTALQLIEQTILTATTLVLLEVTRLRCRKYFL